MLIRASLVLLVLGASLPFGGVQARSVLALQLGASALLAWSFLRRERMPPWGPKARRLVILFLALVAVGGLQLIVGISPPNTVDALLRFTAYGFIACATFVVFRGGGCGVVARALVVVAAFQAFYGAFEFLSGRQHIFGYEKVYYLDSATGTFINRNHFAVYLAMALPFAIELIGSGGGGRHGRGWRERLVALLERDLVRRLMPLLAVFFILSGILLSFSRGGAAAASLGVAVYLTTRRRRGTRRLLVAVLLMLPVILLSWQAGRAPGERFLEHPDQLVTVGERLPAWKVGLSMVPDRPWLGTGFGTFEQAFRAHQPADLPLRWDHVHNDFLQFLIEGGSVTLLLAILAVTVLFRRSPIVRRADRPHRYRAAVAGGLAAVLLHSLVDFPLRIPAIAALTALLVGLYLVTEPRERVARFPRSRA